MLKSINRYNIKCKEFTLNDLTMRRTVLVGNTQGWLYA